MIAHTIGTGIPLIIIHGFGVDHRIMLPLEKMIGDLSWQRFYLDLPWAEAATDIGVETPIELADALLSEVHGIVGDGPFAVVGNSFGAMVARHIAHSLPQQCVGLATLAGAFQPDHSLRILPKHRVTHYDASILEQAGSAEEDFAEMAVIHTPETLASFENYVLPGIRGSKQDVLERLSANYTQAYTPETRSSGTFEAPSLHVFGRQDQVVGFEDGFALRDHYTRGSFVVLDSAGHNAHLEQPAIVGALLREWLHRAESYSN